MQIKTITKDNFMKILNKVDNWAPEFKGHLHSLVNKLDHQNRKAYVAVDGSKVVGFMLYSLSVRRDNKIINIDLTVVDPQFRNQGIAQALKLNLAAKNKNATITAEVSPSNKASQHVNESLGATSIDKTMTMNPKTMLQKAKEKQAARIVPVTKKQTKAIQNISKEKHIKEHGCPPNKSKIRGYTRKDGIRVAAYCRKKRN